MKSDNSYDAIWPRSREEAEALYQAAKAGYTMEQVARAVTTLGQAAQEVWERPEIQALVRERERRIRRRWWTRACWSYWWHRARALLASGTAAKE